MKNKKIMEPNYWIFKQQQKLYGVPRENIILEM